MLFPEWNLNRQLGAAARFRINFHDTLQKFGPLLHAPESQLFLIGKGGLPLAHIKALAVVFYPQADVRTRINKSNLPPGCCGVFFYVGKAFLDEPIDVDGGFVINRNLLKTCAAGRFGCNPADRRPLDLPAGCVPFDPG